MPEAEHFGDVFGQPGVPVGVSFEAPAWVGSLVRSGSTDGSTPSAEAFSLVVSEMSPGAERTWARMGGWPAFGTRIEAVARALGGSIEMHTYKHSRTMAERHEIVWVGEKLEDL